MVRLAAFLLGLFSGAMLLIALALVPFWRSLPPTEFRAWFAAHAGRIGGLMIPLGAASAVAAVAALVAVPECRGWLGLAAASTVGVVVVTVVVNEPANRLFATAGALGDEETRKLLDRWMRWHWVRVALGLAAFAAVLRVVR